nr:unnamed protein product [Digitaria exilis]
MHMTFGLIWTTTQNNLVLTIVARLHRMKMKVDIRAKKIPPAVEDEHHSDKTGVQAIEEHKQEQGSASGHVQALLDMDAETVTEKILYFSKCLNFDTPECGDYHPEYDQEQLNQLGEQLALYRIRAYELTVDRKLAELSDENLKLEYPASKLYDNGFFEYYEESLEWYFDPERCTSARFDNYQRLVLHGYRGYLDWDFYCSVLNTYEEDLAYVQYFEEVANKTKWIEDYLGDSKIEWERIRSLALMQALEIAAGLPNVSPLLVTYGFQEYINSIKRGYYSKGLDGLYFEIWKRVAKEKMNFKEALLEIYMKDMFPSRSFEIKHELENNLGRSPIKNFYDARVASIDKMTLDDKARQLIREVIRGSVSQPLYYLDYARRKLDIANDIELIPKAVGQEKQHLMWRKRALRLKMDNKLEQSSSLDCGKITQDDDEGGHSGKKTPPAVEDEHHSDMTGVYAIEEHKQEQWSASGHVQALLDMDAETVTKRILYFSKRLNFDTPECGDYHPAYDEEQLIQLDEQLALYRIRAYELTMGRKLDELSDENLELEYPTSKLYENGFFKFYEESLEWYFDPQRCKSARYDNYQRLVLHDYHGFLDWDFYYSIDNTYEEDLAYVEYLEEVANKTKWIEDYMGESKIERERIRSLALMQALEIAADFPNVSPLLVTYGFQEYIDSIERGSFSKGLDGLYFEIWKRVAKGKVSASMSFKEALLEIDINNMFPSRSVFIKHELENNLGISPIKDYYDAWVAGIDKMALDDKARQLIRDALRESVPRPKCYLHYARRKLDIAHEIELIPKERRRVVAPQGKGDNGKAKVQMND